MSDQGKQYVYNGVFLRCDKGTIPMPFTVLPRPSRIRGQFQAHELDKVPLVNIKPFGGCAVLYGPCMPAPVLWMGVHQGGLRLGPLHAHPLLESSTCQCGVGGTISILMRPPAPGAGSAPTPADPADATAHEVAEGFKWAALGFAVAGVGLAIAGCFFPPLELAAGASFEAALAASASTAFVAADASFAIGVGIDVGVAEVHPTPANQAVVVGDLVGLALGYGAGKVIGAAVSKFGPAVVEAFTQRAAQGEAQTLRPFMSEADPVADLLGPGRLSHTEEWNATIKMLEEEGVEVIHRENTMAYGPATSPGKPGQLIIDEEASISALRHEAQHYADDKAGGFIGMRQLYDPDLRWQMEYNAYMKEVKMMREMREYETARKLLENARVEKSRIIQDIGSLKK